MQFYYTPPSALPALRPGQLPPRGASDAYVLPPGGPRHFQRRAPDTLDDLDDTRLLADLGLDLCFYQPVLVTAVEGGALFGYRALTWNDGKTVRFCTDEPAAGPGDAEAAMVRLDSASPFLNEDTGLRRQAGTAAFVLAVPPRMSTGATRSYRCARMSRPILAACCSGS